MVNARVIRHTAFWIAINCQGVLLQYSWLPSGLVKDPNAKLLWLSIRADLLVLPVKMLLTYYTMALIKKAFLHKEPVAVLVFKIVAALIAGVFAHRAAGVIFIAPSLFPGTSVQYSELFSVPLGLISLMDLGYVAGIAAALKLFRMAVAKGIREKELVKDKLETELKFLKNQINPHFLFNTLNNIYSLSRKKSDQAPEVVMKLSKLLRFMLYESGKESIAITEEIKILKDYVELEKIRYNERLAINFEVEVDNAQQPITPLILLPFIENAFKHGVNSTTGRSEISIDLRVKEGRLDFSVSNTTDKDGNTAIEEKIGLTNVRRQLELMYSDYSLDIGHRSGSFNILLAINLNAYASI